MDINTVYTGFLVGFIGTTALAVLCMALAGLLVALYAAIPATRAWFDERVFSEEERSHSKAMTDVDRTMSQQLKELRRSTHRTITLQP